MAGQASRSRLLSVFALFLFANLVRFWSIADRTSAITQYALVVEMAMCFLLVHYSGGVYFLSFP